MRLGDDDGDLALVEMPSPDVLAGLIAASLVRALRLIPFRGGLRGDDPRLGRPNARNGARRRRLRVEVNQVTQMQETGDVILAALAAGLGETDWIRLAR